MTTLQEAAEKALVALAATIPGTNTGTADAWDSWHNLRTGAIKSLMFALAQQGEHEVLAYLHDDGYWTIAKTNAGRAFEAQRPHTKVPVYTAAPAPQP